MTDYTPKKLDGETPEDAWQRIGKALRICGPTATPEDVDAMHHAIRAALDDPKAAREANGIAPRAADPLPVIRHRPPRNIVEQQADRKYPQDRRADWVHRGATQHRAALRKDPLYAAAFAYGTRPLADNSEPTATTRLVKEIREQPIRDSDPVRETAATTDQFGFQPVTLDEPATNGPDRRPTGQRIGQSNRLSRVSVPLSAFKNGLRHFPKFGYSYENHRNFAEARKSLQMPAVPRLTWGKSARPPQAIWDCLAYRLLQYPESENPLWQDVPNRQYKTGKAEQPWLDYTEREMPAPIRFSREARHLGQVQAIPLFPRQYHGNTVEIRHFYIQELSDLQREVLAQIFRKAAENTNTTITIASDWIEVEELHNG